MANPQHMRTTRLLLLLFLLFPCGVALAKLGEKPDPYEKIETQAKADEVFKDVQAFLRKNWGFSLSRPVQLALVHESEMDKLLAGNPYKGAEVGLYTMKDGHHQIYVMRGWNRDYCSGVTAHEFTHAWQADRCPYGQDIVLREGFASWIEMKYYDATGAYQMADNLRQQADPVYGVGIKTMMALEDKIGAKKLVELVQKISTVDEANKVLKK